MKVRDIMSSPAVAVSPQMTIREALDTMRGHGIRAVPVVLNGRLVGVLADRDIIMGSLPGAKPGTPVAELMTGNPEACHVEHSVSEAAARMAGCHVRRLPVLDGAQKLVGVISAGDIARAARRHMIYKAAARAGASAFAIRDGDIPERIRLPR